MQNPPLVTAVVLNYNSAQSTIACVHALQKQTIASQVEIIVIDNHSEDDSMGILQHSMNGPHITLMEAEQNLGYGKANNRASKYANGAYIFIINPDNELEEAGLESMVQVLRNDESIGIIAPKLVYPDGTLRESFRKFPSILDILIKRTPLRHLCRNRMKQYLQDGAVPDVPTDTDWLIGSCLLMKTDLFKALQGFDERFFLFFEDTDLCLRCWQLGKRVVFVPNITAQDQKERLSAGGMFSFITKKTVRIHIASAIRYFWKWKTNSKKTGSLLTIV